MAENTAPSILIWVPEGQIPVAPDFQATGAATFNSLADAVLHAQTLGESRGDRAWIMVSDVVFGPDQIRVLAQTLLSQQDL